LLPIRQRNVIRPASALPHSSKDAGHGRSSPVERLPSLNHIYAQIIDDAKGETLLSASSLAAKVKTGGNVAAAKEVGSWWPSAPSKRESSGSSSTAAAYLYHGRIKALADAAREAGLEF